VAGWVPVVVAGHTHERSSSSEDGTTFLTVGSTGATGLGSFMVDTRAAYEAEVLRFDGSRLVAVDYVTLRGVSGEFTVERQVVDRPGAAGRDGTARVEDDDGDDDGSRRSP
jgi:hypothetical protein